MLLALHSHGQMSVGFLVGARPLTDWRRQKRIEREPSTDREQSIRTAHVLTAGLV